MRIHSFVRVIVSGGSQCSEKVAIINIVTSNSNESHRKTEDEASRGKILTITRCGFRDQRCDSHVAVGCHPPMR